jgi:sulfur-oxidizing protein SoxY
VQVAYAGQRLFDAETDFSVSENPSWRFNFVPRERGLLTAEVEDTKDGRFTDSLDPWAAP